MSDVAAAFVSLALRQRRYAHEAKRDALAAERAGNMERYRAARKRSDRLWRAAKWNLSFAKEWK